jgi:phospholipase/carboxylesterase
MVGWKTNFVMSENPSEQLWIELPPINDVPPTRLLILLHGAVSSVDKFAPVAIAWQLKFPTAAAFILQAPERSLMEAERFSWFSPAVSGDQRAIAIKAAAKNVADKLATIQKSTGLTAQSTLIVGFSQGATVALELARSESIFADIIIAYAGQLSSTVLAGQVINARTIHLVHGELDSIVTPDQAERTYRQLMLAHGDVTLDVIEDGTHAIDQDFITVGTTRAMQSIFRGRAKKTKSPGDAPRTLH